MPALQFSFADTEGWDALHERIAKPWIWRAPADLPPCLYHDGHPRDLDRLAACGCRDCFAAMVPDLRRVALGAVRRTLGPSSYLPGLDQDDLVSEVLIIASLKLPDQDPARGSFDRFVSGIAVNVVKRARRVARKGGTQHLVGEGPRPRTRVEVRAAARRPKAPGTMWELAT